MIVLLLSYFYWHYLHALPLLMRRVDASLMFVTRFFSAKELLANFVTPWVYHSRRNAEDSQISRFIINITRDILLRLLGIVIRSVALGVCLALQVVIMAIGLVVLVLWILLPLICVSAIGYFVWMLF